MEGDASRLCGVPRGVDDDFPLLRGAIARYQGGSRPASSQPTARPGGISPSSVERSGLLGSREWNRAEQREWDGRRRRDEARLR